MEHFDIFFEHYGRYVIEAIIALLNLYTMFSLKRVQVDKQMIQTLKEEKQEQTEVIEMLQKQIDRLKVHRHIAEIRHEELQKYRAAEQVDIK